jgi:hypothetical protein
VKRKAGAATRRVERGRSHSYLLDGQAVDGVTTIIGDGVPKKALAPWAAGAVADFAVANLATITALDPAAAVDLLKGAPWRDRDAAARRGTEVHRLGQHLVAGDEVTVPDELVGHVDSYVAFLNDWQANPVLVETVVLHRRHGWMGTLDLVADLADGHRWLLDLKTTRSGVFAESALQLAAYRHAEHYLDAEGAEQPMVTVERCGVVWVRADGYDVIPVEAGDEVYAFFRAAQWVATFANTVAKGVLAPALPARPL